MKYLLLLNFLILTSCAPFKVGDCVRELGYDRIEKVTATTQQGAVETVYYSEIIKRNARPVYDVVQASRLIKIQCVPN